MHKKFDKVMAKILYVASEYNLMFSAINVLVGATYFLTISNRMIILSILLFLLFNFLILVSSMGRTKEKIEKLDIHGSVTAKVTILKAKPILMLTICAIIASFHILTNSVIIKAAIIFVASILLSESWTNELKKQILDAIDKVKEVQ